MKRFWSSITSHRVSVESFLSMQYTKRCFLFCWFETMPVKTSRLANYGNTFKRNWNLYTFQFKFDVICQGFSIGNDKKWKKNTSNVNIINNILLAKYLSNEATINFCFYFPFLNWFWESFTSKFLAFILFKVKII